MTRENIIIKLLTILLMISIITFIIITIYLSSKIESPEQINNILKMSKQQNIENGKVRITVDGVTEVMSGLYSQYRKLNIPILNIEVENPFTYSISVYLESEITGLSYTSRSLEILKPKSRVQIIHYPKLIDSTPINRNTVFSLEYTIKIDSRTVTQNSFEINFISRDVLFWGYIDSNNKFIDTSKLISAWVTPNIIQIRQLLRKAINYHPNKGLYGYQLESNDPIELKNYARAQVKAIYDTIKHNYEIRYVNTPIAFTPNNIVSQRINLPSETLSRGIANCIDSTVLFASVIEAIGMNPYIIIIPGHSLLGWSIDKNSSILDIMDVTYVSDVEFEDAIRIGFERLQAENINISDNYLYKGDKYAIISIKEARRLLNIDPME